ncbi:MAG: hypothetical protein M3Q11_03090 [Pseudomonadota bacterium]|nr:hypothetical protein [Pseudomonadota bacterium]
MPWSADINCSGDPATRRPGEREGDQRAVLHQRQRARQQGHSRIAAHPRQHDRQPVSAPLDEAVERGRELLGRDHHQQRRGGGDVECGSGERQPVVAAVAARQLQPHHGEHIDDHGRDQAQQYASDAAAGRGVGERQHQQQRGDEHPHLGHEQLTGGPDLEYDFIGPGEDFPGCLPNQLSDHRIGSSPGRGP